MRLAANMTVCMAAAGCGQPRTHAGVHITPDGTRLVPPVSTSIAGIGATASE